MSKIKTALEIIQALGRKIAAKKEKTPEGITQIQPQIYAESEAGSIAQTLVNAGLPVERFDEFITSEADVVRLLNQIKALEKKNLADNIRSGITNTESAKVFDLKGRQIKNTDNIMGGEELPPPGSRGGPDDIAAPVQSSEESLRDMIVAENKKNIAKIRKRKMLDEAIDDASPGFSGDRKVDAELVAENLAERMGLSYDDMPTKERLKLYDEAFTGLSKKKFDPEGKADGGRIGYKLGSLDKARRSFLKKAAGIGGGIAALKAGLIGLGKQAGTAVESVKETVTRAPSYFFDLVAKIKMLGKEGVPLSERMNVTNYKNFELTEDITTGDVRVTKRVGDPDAPGYREEVMEYNKGGVPDEDVGMTRESYDEATIFADMDGKMKDIEDGIEPDSIKEIIKEATDQAPSIKKAEGGLAYMLGE